jgi:hypothetical protein
MKKGCEKEIERRVSVSNGWTKYFKTKCGWFFDGKEEYCDKCKQ